MLNKENLGFPGTELWQVYEGKDIFSPKWEVSVKRGQLGRGRAPNCLPIGFRGALAGKLGLWAHSRS